MDALQIEFRPGPFPFASSNKDGERWITESDGNEMAEHDTVCAQRGNQVEHPLGVEKRIHESQKKLS
jgi:hypothetical protein